jgi:ABC-type nickel/cobalt efflux system permease component RcnA
VLSATTLTIDGEAVVLGVSTSTLELLPGQAGLDIIRLEATFSGTVPPAGTLGFRDGNLPGRAGWHEILAVASGGVRIVGSDVPATSPTDRLRRYPTDPLVSPMDVREATVTFEAGAGVPAAPATEARSGSSTRPGVVGSAFTDLVDRTGGMMVLALGLAFAFGVLHALGPGHGKTLVASFLVGAGGRARHAVLVGASVAAMHTASVLVLGLIVLTATEVLAPERVYPWLGLASGPIAIALGAGLLTVRLRSRRSGAHDDASHPLGHGHPHRPGERHGHGHDGDLGPSRRGLVALALAGGIMPSPTALVVLLASAALHRVGYGLALLGAFSVGLAVTLAAVGAIALRARDAVADRMSGRVARALPIASAWVTVGLGLAMTAGALLNL